VQYRLGGRKGRTRRITIGRHGELTPTTARAEAKRLLGEIAAARDPATERDMTKAGKSLAMVLKQFMAEHVERRLARRAKRWARSSIAVNGETGRSFGSPCRTAT
jgi:Arm DNA-binding domain